MAKPIELAFALAGKLLPSFTTATQAASAQLTELHGKVEKASKAAQARIDAKMFKNLSKASGDAGKALSGFYNEIAGATKIAAVATAGVAGIYKTVLMNSADYADAAIENAQSVGMSTAAFTEMAYAAELAGASQQDFVTASAKLNKMVQDALGGSKSAIENFDRAGISLRDGDGNLKTTEQLWTELSDIFASMPDGIGKTSLAMAFFGRSGSKFVPFLSAGSDALNQLREDAIRLGISLSDTDAANAGAFSDSFLNIGKALRGVSLVIGKELWPHLTKVHKEISKCITTNGQLLAQNLPGWVDQFKQAWPEMKEGLKAVCKGVKETAVAINGLVQDIGGWAPLIKNVIYYWGVWRGLRLAYSVSLLAVSIGGLTKTAIQSIPALWRQTETLRGFGLKGIMYAHKGLTRLCEGFGRGLRSAADFGASIASKAAPALRSFGGVLSRGALHTAEFIATIGAKAVTGIQSFARAALSASVRGLSRFTGTISIAAGHVARFAVAMATKGVAALASFAASVGAGIISALSALGAGLTSAATAAWGFAAALLANPVTWIVAGIAALGVAVYMLWKHWDTVGKRLTTAWEFWKDAARSAFAAISGAFSAAWGSVKGVFDSGWSLLSGMFDAAFTPVVAAATAFGGRIREAFSAAWGSVKSISETAWSSVTSLVETAWGNVMTVFETAWNAVSAFLGERFEAVMTAFDQGFLAGLAAMLEKFNPAAIFADALNDLVKYIFDFDIVSAATNLMTRFGEGLLSAWDSIKSGVASAVTEWIPGGETMVNMASSGANLISSGAGAVAAAAGGAYDYAASLLPFANGGIATHPTPAIVGEAGPEVIVPVTRPNRARELMDAASGMMGQGGGGIGGGGTEYTITFSPKISISGVGESVAEQVRQSMFQAKEDLRRMLKELALENSRMAMR